MSSGRKQEGIVMPANAIGRIVVGILIGLLTILVAACGQDNELQDTGPNAKLSNEELLKKAVADMKALKSYRMEFKGGLPSEQVVMAPDTVITADMQLNGKGNRITITGSGSPSQ